MEFIVSEVLPPVTDPHGLVVEGAGGAEEGGGGGGGGAQVKPLGRRGRGMGRSEGGGWTLQPPCVSAW